MFVFSVNMESQCPVIENVDDNLNKEEVTDTTLGSKEEEEENNSNELSSVNDNESPAQNQNSDGQEQTRNLVNKSLQADSVESSSESSPSISAMEKDREAEEAEEAGEATDTNKTDQTETETESVDNQQVKWNLVFWIDEISIFIVSCLHFVCQNCDAADCAQDNKNIYRVKWIR